MRHSSKFTNGSRWSASKLGESKFMLIAAGITLGYLARLVLGGPTDNQPPRTFNNPIVEPDEDVYDLPIIRKPRSSNSNQDNSGPVPPLLIPGVDQSQFSPSLSLVSFADFEHSSSAVFEPHGEHVCASGCAVSRHPTGTLTLFHFQKLLDRYSRLPLDSTNEALEELLFYGHQSRRLIAEQGVGDLSLDRTRFLNDQLNFTHAKISIRVVDAEGRVRTWIDPTRVPLDRRHVFEMNTNDLQPLVTSGTVKRVGLNHLWTRL